MSSASFLAEVKDCPECKSLMFWWDKGEGRFWWCEECGHAEPYQSSLGKVK